MTRDPRITIRTRRDRPVPAAAFTITELMTVAAIIAVVSAIALPRFAAAQSAYRARAAARGVAAYLNEARAYAMASSAPVNVRVNLADHELWITQYAGPSTPREITLFLASEPYSATIVSAALVGTVFTYSPYGDVSESVTLVIGAGGRQATVAVDPDSGVAGVSP